MERIFAIGDIHGCSKTFEKLLKDKIQLTKEDNIYCIGDYIDRGDDSKGVIDLIIELRAEGYPIYTLRGNHEQMMLDAVNDKKSLNLWLDNGGKKTLKSFGIKSQDELPQEYFSFLKETEFYLQKDNYIFVHAGLNFRNENLFEDKEAMLWERDFFPQQPALEDRLLIHGHTPIPLTFILKQKGNCINIDGGCVYRNRPHFGHLVAIDLKKREFLIEENCE
ncbi:MAG: serine/threonine protein phosphatase [Bacteroidota bacterium]|nr:serine/threonine protein phosphatase [Bacteroidota bacterium]